MARRGSSRTSCPPSCCALAAAVTRRSSARSTAASCSATTRSSGCAPAAATGCSRRRWSAARGTGVYAGGWSASLAAAQEARPSSRARPTSRCGRSPALAAAAALTGLRGDLERALALADEAEAAAPAAARPTACCSMIEYARGLARLGGDDARPARSRTSRACSIRASRGTRASSRAGRSPTPPRPRSAPTSAARARELRRRTPPRSRARRGTSRRRSPTARLLLATDAEADARAEAALAPASSCPRCARGCSSPTAAHLRRRRRAAEARALLRAARDTFEALDMGAGRRARAAASCAPRARPCAPPPWTRRRAHRRRSCRSRGWPPTGLSNREIGQALYLSHRTIGSHLYRVFPKLGIASRGELRAAAGSVAVALERGADARARADLELGEDPRQVVPDRARRQRQVGGDRRVGHPARGHAARSRAPAA